MCPYQPICDQICVYFLITVIRKECPHQQVNNTKTIGQITMTAWSFPSLHLWVTGKQILSGHSAMDTVAKGGKIMSGSWLCNPTQGEF